MKYAIAPILLVALVVGMAVAKSQQSDRDPGASSKSNGDTAPAIETISVADFKADNVIGHLGYPLGTVVRITGIAVDGDSTRVRSDMGKTLLEIHTVNGKKLEKTAMFDFGRAPKNVSKPSAGEKFDYYAYEYGAFDGVVVPPRGLNINVPIVAHDGFYYRRHITIYKSLK